MDTGYRFFWPSQFVQLRSAGSLCAWQKTVTILVGAGVGLAVGCSGQSSINPASAARLAVEMHDTNGDEVLSAEELKSCPGIGCELARYDTNSDGQLTAEEIAGRIDTFLDGSARFMSFSCTVTLNGRPLQGALVELVPEDFLGTAVEPAQGTTTANGSVELSVSQDALPPANQPLKLVRPGIYQVRVTHPRVEIPPRYHATTELGCEVSGEASNPAFPLRFELTSR